MATEWISPTWRMPENSNQSKVDNYSLDFAGSAKIEYATPVDLGVVSTFSFWMNIDTGTTGALFGNTLLGTYEYIVYYSGSAFYFKIAGAYADFPNAATAISTGQWHHVAFVRPSENEVKCYIDSVLTDTITSWTGTPGSNPIKFDLIGSRPGGGLAYSGKMGQIAGFDSILTSDQITALYNSGTPVNPMALTPLPTSYYPLGGGSTGSASTLTVPNEAVPDATVFDFDGSSDYIDLDPGVMKTFSTDNVSISAWLKADALGTYNYVYADGHTSGNKAVSLAYASVRGGLEFTVGNTTVARASGVAINTGEWYHVVCTYAAGGDLKFYLNGNTTPAATATFSGALDLAGHTVSSIGRSNIHSNYYWDGEISNVQVWNAELGTADVTTLYNNGVPLLTGTQPESASLKGWWRMNIDTSTWDGTNWEIGDARSSYTSSINTTSRAFRTSTTALSDFMGSSVTNFTWSMWVRNTSGDTGSSSLVSWSYPGSSSYKDGIHQWYGNLALFGTAANKILFGSINDGLWKHVLIAVDLTAGATWDDCVKCFINGQPRAMTSSTGTPPTSMDWTAGGSNQRDIGVGVGYVVSHSFHGDISNYTLYNSTLGQTEATDLYNNGTPVTTAVGSPTAWWKINNLTTGLEDVSGNSYNIEQWGTTQVVVDGLVSAVNGETSGMTTANLVTSDLTRSIPYSSYSMTFDGTADYISVSDVSNIATNTQGSISFWINFAGDSSTRYAFSVSDTNADTFLTIGIDSSENLDIILREVTTPNLWRLQTTGNPIVLDTWHHICLTQNGTACEVYVDGAKPTQSGAGTEWLNDLSGLDLLTIGALYKNSALVNPIEGNISNVSVFNTALSEDQIITIYNGGVPNSISSLSPINWWSLSGDSYFDGSNFICPDLGSGGNNGTSTGMGGTELVGDGPGSTSNGVATNMDIPGNLKGNAPNSISNSFSVNMTAIDRVASVPG